MVDVYGALLSGRRRCQSAGSSRPLLAIWSMSPASASVTTSARSPSITDRACLPEPPCEVCTVTVPPVRARQSSANARLTSW